MKVEQEYKDKAKKEGMAIFSVMIDRRHIPLTDGGGYKHESAGCMTLYKASRIVAIIREPEEA